MSTFWLKGGGGGGGGLFGGGWGDVPCSLVERGGDEGEDREDRGG